MLVEKVRRTVEEHKLISKGQHIVVGLSGGPDSVCLFHILMRLRKEYDLTIHPVHINHKFRPGAAERDQAYVEELCRKNGLECRTFVVDCNVMADELHMTSEEAGRKARYDAFYQVANEVGMHEDVKIAVAQNANDQAETILFRLLRGTGTDGLAGIAYERKERGISVEDIALASGMEYGTVSGLASLLESDGMISVDILRRCSINIRKSKLFD